MSALQFILTVITCITLTRVCSNTINITEITSTTAKSVKQREYHDTNLTYHFALASLLINGTITGSFDNLTTLQFENITTIPFVNYTETVLNNTNSTFEDPRARIIGGEPAYEGEFKYQLSIRFFNRHHCGASLITVDELQLAITAAHCVRDALPEDLTLIAGDLTRSDITGREQVRQVVDVVKHENFEFIEGVPSYDIALLFIEKPFQENAFVGTIGLPREGQETRGKVVVSGWGDDNPRYAGRPSDKLMKVEVPIVEMASCKRAYSFIVDEFYDHFLCAGYMMRGVHKDSCQGDSGGPVRSVEGNYLAGIVSWGAGCGIPQFPGVNTKVSYFTEWINDNVRRFKTDSSSEEESREEEEEGEYNDLQLET